MAYVLPDRRGARVVHIWCTGETKDLSGGLCEIDCRMFK